MTTVIHIRLNDAEHEMLDEILASELCESENRSELIRLWLYREWNKRKGLGVPKFVYQTANRVGGRPPAPIPRKALLGNWPTFSVCDLHGYCTVINKFSKSALKISPRIPESGGASRADSLHKATGSEISRKGAGDISPHKAVTGEISVRRPRSKRTVEHSGKGTKNNGNSSTSPRGR